jgi:hypothetical protein
MDANIGAKRALDKLLMNRERHQRWVRGWGKESRRRKSFKRLAKKAEMNRAQGFSFTMKPLSIPLPQPVNVRVTIYVPSR